MAATSTAPFADPPEFPHRLRSADDDRGNALLARRRAPARAHDRVLAGDRPVWRLTSCRAGASGSTVGSVRRLPEAVHARNLAENPACSLNLAPGGPRDPRGVATVWPGSHKAANRSVAGCRYPASGVKPPRRCRITSTSAASRSPVSTDLAQFVRFLARISTSSSRTTFHVRPATIRRLRREDRP